MKMHVLKRQHCYSRTSTGVWVEMSKALDDATIQAYRTSTGA